MKNSHLPILMYHKIGKASKETKIRGLYTSEKYFEKQIILLKKNNYSFIHFGDLLSGKTPENPILITFDDGHIDNYTNAFSIIKKHNIKVTIFLIANDMGRENVIWNEAAESEQSNIMTWNQAKIMNKSGLVDFQSHGMSHKYLNRLSKTNLNFELTESFRLLKKNLGHYPIAISYPYGGFNETVIKKAQECGYKFACTTNSGINNLNSLDKYKLKRTAIRGHKWIYFFKFRQMIKKGFT